MTHHFPFPDLPDLPDELRNQLAMPLSAHDFLRSLFNGIQVIPTPQGEGRPPHVEVLYRVGNTFCTTGLSLTMPGTGVLVPPFEALQEFLFDGEHGDLMLFVHREDGTEDPEPVVTHQAWLQELLGVPLHFEDVEPNEDTEVVEWWMDDEGGFAHWWYTADGYARELQRRSERNQALLRTARVTSNAGQPLLEVLRVDGDALHPTGLHLELWMSPEVRLVFVEQGIEEQLNPKGLLLALLLTPGLQVPDGDVQLEVRNLSLPEGRDSEDSVFAEGYPTLRMQQADLEYLLGRNLNC